MNPTLEHLTALTDRALFEATEHDWRKALDIQRLRNEEMRQLFAQLESHEIPDDDALKATLQYLLESDEKLKRLIGIQQLAWERDASRYKLQRKAITDNINHRPM